jgi:hypothetical protein
LRAEVGKSLEITVEHVERAYELVRGERGALAKLCRVDPPPAKAVGA